MFEISVIGMIRKISIIGRILKISHEKVKNFKFTFVR